MDPGSLHWLVTALPPGAASGPRGFAGCSSASATRVRVPEGLWCPADCEGLGWKRPRPPARRAGRGSPGKFTPIFFF